MKNCYPSKYIVSFVLLLLCLDLIAQTKEKKGFIGVLVNPSFPVGNFADNNIKNTNAGFAMESYSISDIVINFGYRFGKNIGISASYFTSDYVIDSTAKDLMMYIAGIKAGPMFSIPISDKLFFDTKINFGYITTGLMINVPNYKSNNGFGLVIDFSTSFRYNLFRRWSLIAECGYLLSNPKFDDDRTRKVRVINLGAGIAFRL